MLLISQASPLQNTDRRSLRLAQRFISTYLLEWQALPGQTKSQRRQSQLLIPPSTTTTTTVLDKDHSDKSFETYFQGLQDRVLSRAMVTKTSVVFYTIEMAKRKGACLERRFSRTLDMSAAGMPVGEGLVLVPAIRRKPNDYSLGRWSSRSPPKRHAENLGIPMESTLSTMHIIFTSP